MTVRVVQVERELQETLRNAAREALGPKRPTAKSSD